MQYLRAIEPEDLDLMYLLENDPLVSRYSSTTVPLSRYALKRYIEESHGDLYADLQVRLAIMDPDTNASCGFLDLTDVSPLHRRAQIGIVLVPEMQGKGIATRALDEVGVYARSNGLAQLYAIVPNGNAASDSLFRRGGYMEIAILPKWLVLDGKSTDAKLYAKQLVEL